MQISTTVYKKSDEVLVSFTGGDHQGRHALSVGSIHIGPFGDEQLGDVKIPTSAGYHQRTLLLTKTSVGVASLEEQKPHDWIETSFASIRQGTHRKGHEVYLDVLDAKQKMDEVFITSHRRHHQARLLGPVPRVDIGSHLQQYLDDVPVAFLAGHHQRCLAVLINNVDIASLLHDQSDPFQVSIRRGHHQRCPSVRIFRVDLPALFGGRLQHLLS